MLRNCLVSIAVLLIVACARKQPEPSEQYPGRPAVTSPIRQVPSVPEASEHRSISVRVLLSTRPKSGTVVTVSGLCYGLAGLLAAGPPPSSRSDWQLGDGSVAVFVVGPIPLNCVQQANAPSVTIRATVRRDSVAVRLGGPLVERLYLRLP